MPDIRFVLVEVTVAQFACRLAAADIHPVVEEARGDNAALSGDPVQQEDFCVDNWPEGVFAVFLLDPVVEAEGLESLCKVSEDGNFLFFSRHTTNDALGGLALVADWLGHWAAR